MILKYKSAQGEWVYIDNVREARLWPEKFRFSHQEALDMMSAPATFEGRYYGPDAKMESSHEEYNRVRVYERPACGPSSFDLYTANESYLLNENGKTIERLT